MGKFSFVNEGEFLDGGSQIDFLLFGVATPMGFSNPIADKKVASAYSGLWVASQKKT
jgi:hypothetical protein